MKKLYIKHISGILAVNEWQVEHCVQLLEEGATVPFISRYRKERTGQLDEVQVAQIKHWCGKFEELEKRKEGVLKSIQEQGQLTGQLEKEIASCIAMQDLEDIYMPYKPKRRTRATMAKEKGLEPLALQMLTFDVANFDSVVSSYINGDLPNRESVLQGARDIIAETVAE
ncbi:MAG: RNA-binding transcriptional accessory protein, partial [Bacteroidales bacterium]|nr:RNA-binding transcriptional accessory protein [Bacteroidales bacterium]